MSITFENGFSIRPLAIPIVAFVKVYDGALTLADIQTLHAAYKSRVGY
jgi:hypothetical protein